MATVGARRDAVGPLVLNAISIRRSGEFLQLVQPGANHCGPASALVDWRAPSKDPTTGRITGHRTGRAIPIKYELLATCSPTLDHRGFLFDQTSVQGWLEASGLHEPTSLSCEALVITMANRFQDKLARDAPHCELRGLSLSFSPAPHLAAVQVHMGRPPKFNV